MAIYLSLIGIKRQRMRRFAPKQPGADELKYKLSIATALSFESNIVDRSVFFVEAKHEIPHSIGQVGA